MKKITYLFMSAAIAASVVPTSSFAAGETVFTDIDGTEYYSDAAEALSELYILEGYEDNTFKAENNITRAEMTAIICRMTGDLPDNTNYDITDFNDVDSSHWACGYIKTAVDSGIVNGYGDGTFRPEDNVTYEEALKMVVCAFGFDEDIKSDPDDWSAPYIEIADEKNITDKLTGSKGEPSDRGDIAVMVYNGLKATITPPSASKSSGTYSGSQKIELSTDNKDVEIYYTADGSDPAVYGVKYTSAITISRTTQIKAITVLGGAISSDTAEFKYTINTSSGGGGGGSISSSTVKYTVSFDLNYEDAAAPPDEQKIKKGGKITEPDAPTRDGYTFEGWFTDESCTEPFDPETDTVSKNMTLYAGWKEAESDNENGDNSNENEDSQETSIRLTADKTNIVVGDSETVTFYAEILNSDNSFSSITLYDQNANPIMTMSDDGMYSENGDELSNDNIYTCRAEINTASEIMYTFQAVALGSESVASNRLSVNIIEDITDEQLKNMETVDLTIEDDLFGIDEYEEMSVSDRKTLAETILKDLESRGLIRSGSITADDENCSFTFIYESGVLGGVCFKDWNEEQNGGDENALNSEPIQIADRVEIDFGDGTETDEGSDSNTDDSSDGNTDIIYNPELENIHAVILWSFDQAWDSLSYRQPFYQEVEDDWNSAGLSASVNWEPTVEDYKNLDDYEIIVFSGHGSYYTYTDTSNSEQKNLASIILHEESTLDKDDQYSIDLKLMNIGKMSVQGGTMYTILPDFWEYYYSNGELDGSFVFSENCELEGKNDSADSSMSDAIIASAAESVIGFYNSVMADYSRNLMKAYVDSLISGSTSGDAFEAAKEEYGETDYFTGRELYGETAYPVFSGSESSLLIDESLVNGSLELYPDLTGWEHTGDTRVISKLGELVPQHGERMGILTTGIGSGTSDYTNATEGSTLYQSFKVSSSNPVISFDYDVVSEEPMEYIGSFYDDKFIVEIIDPQNSKILLAEESVNKSEWIDVSGVDFDGGDLTAYHTGWKTVTYDLSEYAGQTVTLKFTVYDVGDSKYDTAALIDNIIFN